YVRDLFQLAQYFHSQSITWETVTNDNLADYRDYRLGQGLSPRSWQRETVVLRAFFNFLVEQGLLSETPWQQIGNYSVVKPRPDTYEMGVGALSHEQWRQFRHVGFGGELPGGSMDISLRGGSVQRDTAASELAITTALRL